MLTMHPDDGRRICKSLASWKPPVFCGLSPDELVYVEDRRQQEVPDDHERGQTQGNDYTSESVNWPNRRPHEHRRNQSDREPDRRILHVAEHEVTLARQTRANRRRNVIATPTTHGHKYVRRGWTNR